VAQPRGPRQNLWTGARPNRALVLVFLLFQIPAGLFFYQLIFFSNVDSSCGVGGATNLKSPSTVHQITGFYKRVKQRRAERKWTRPRDTLTPGGAKAGGLIFQRAENTYFQRWSPYTWCVLLCNFLPTRPWKGCAQLHLSHLWYCQM